MAAALPALPLRAFTDPVFSLGHGFRGSLSGGEKTPEL